MSAETGMTNLRVELTDALRRIEDVLFETLGSKETGDALKAIAIIPDCLSDIATAMETLSDRLYDIDGRIADVRDALVDMASKDEE